MSDRYAVSYSNLPYHSFSVVPKEEKYVIMWFNFIDSLNRELKRQSKEFNNKDNSEKNKESYELDIIIL